MTNKGRLRKTLRIGDEVSLGTGDQKILLTVDQVDGKNVRVTFVADREVPIKAVCNG